MKNRIDKNQILQACIESRMSWLIILKPRVWSQMMAFSQMESATSEDRRAGKYELLKAP
jgi:hypothetical protein